MNISPVSQTLFRAKTTVYTTKKSYLDTYDEAIKEIKKSKKLATELEHFMTTDKEVKKVLNKLPKDDVVELDLDLPPVDIDEDDTLCVDHQSLQYVSKNNQLPNELRGFLGISFDYKVNKEGIINWLNQIAQYFNNN